MLFTPRTRTLVGAVVLRGDQARLLQYSEENSAELFQALWGACGVKSPDDLYEATVRPF